MELYNIENSIEWRLAFKSDIAFHPLGGTMEITPLCNMNCRMCYIRHARNQVDEKGGLLSINQWLKIAENAKKAGVLYLLITGGEPFSYPDFDVLYSNLMQMGFVIQINTNGTMLTGKYQKLLKELPPRKLNITLYGSSNEEYEKICGNTQGFSQVMKAIAFLKENNINFAFNYTITEENRKSSEWIIKMAEEYDTTITTAHYLFAPIRKEQRINFERLPAEAVAECMVKNRAGNTPLHDFAINQLKKINSPVRWKERGFSCRAGHSGFWIDWRGNLLPCGMFLKPSVNLLEISFENAWREIVAKSSEMINCKECEHCKYHPLCEVCLAKCYTETGSSDGKPEYQCQITKAYTKLLISYLTDREIQENGLNDF